MAQLPLVLRFIPLHIATFLGRCLAIWVFPKIMVPPNHPILNPGFPLFSSSILGEFSPYFWFNTLAIYFPDSVFYFSLRVLTARGEFAMGT